MARVPIYPPLLAAYPILALFAVNAYQVRANELAMPIAVAVALSAAAWLALGLLLHGASRSAAVAAAVILLFYSVEPAADWASAAFTYASGFWVQRRVWAGPGWVLVPEVVLLIASVVWVARGARGLAPLTAWLNAMALIATVLVVVPISHAKAPEGPQPPWRPTPLASVALPPGTATPDIYYIILDGYARGDVLKSHFDFDNSDFLDHLERRGFFVARNSPANYCQTPLCLSSSLNADYLDEMVKDLGDDQTMLKEFIGRNRVFAGLEPMGYRMVTFASGFEPTEHPEADRYLSPRPYATEFLRMLIDMTPLRRLPADPSQSDRFLQARERTNYLFDHLPDVARDPRPTFTFAHVLCPHPPMIFGPDGEDVSHANEKFLLYSHKVNGRFEQPERFRRAYQDQVTYITRRIRQTIDRILDESPEPPIIILQSDHGSELNLDMWSVENTDLHERMSILNAYYFPGRRYERLYTSISPVNSFRVVFNTFFGARLPLLPDRSFFSTWMLPYKFIEVTNAIRTRPRETEPDGSGKSFRKDAGSAPAEKSSRQIGPDRRTDRNEHPGPSVGLPRGF